MGDSHFVFDDAEIRSLPPENSFDVSADTDPIMTEEYQRLLEIKENMGKWMRFKGYEVRGTATKKARELKRSHTSASKTTDQKCPKGVWDSRIKREDVKGRMLNVVWAKFIGEQKTQGKKES